MTRAIRRVSAAQAIMAALIVVLLVIPAYASGFHVLGPREFCWRGCGPLFLYGSSNGGPAALALAVWMFVYPALVVVQLAALVLAAVSLATRRAAMGARERLLHLAVPFAVAALLAATWWPVLHLVDVVAD
jgi:hypothetical protein